jgi:hypothetical protein
MVIGNPNIGLPAMSPFYTYDFAATLNSNMKGTLQKVNKEIAKLIREQARSYLMRTTKRTK